MTVRTNVPLNGDGDTVASRDDACPSCVSRRSLLKTAVGMTAASMAGLTGPMLSTRLAFAASPAYTGDVVVVLSLRGGMDGLSVVVPAGDPAYYTNRPTIAVAQNQLLQVNGMFGLHPALAPLAPFWAAGKMGAVHAVGQVDPTRSHFDATEEMERAAPGSSIRTGWLDRALGLRSMGSVFQASHLGWDLPPESLNGPFNELALGRIDGFTLDVASDVTESNRWATALSALTAGAPNAVTAPASAAIGAFTTTTAMKAAGYTPANGAVYDTNSSLASALRDVARLIKADVGLQAATLDYNNWDMHQDLGSATAGWMFDNLTELSSALAAFATDMGTSGMANVTVVTLSEFGRRVEENGSGGVDHGHGNVVLMLGGGVNGGQVYGTWPGLADNKLDNGDLAGTTDYRVILSEVLRKRCGQSSLSTVFPGLSGSELGVVQTKP